MLHAQDIATSAAPLQLSRQPVFDANFEVMGYALLMRGGEGQAKEQVEAILGSYASRYADRVVGNQLAFVRVGESHIRMGLASVLPQDVLSWVVDSGTVNEDLSEEVKRLVSRGHLIALGFCTHCIATPFTSRTICEARHSTVFTRTDICR